MPIVEILKLGLPGLVFLLSVLSYQLIAKGLRQKNLNPSLVRTIRTFMHFNVGLAALTLAVPALDHLVPNPDKVPTYSAEAHAGSPNMELGTALVCPNAAYNDRYLLVSTTEDKSALIQVLARSTPCSKSDQIVLSDLDMQRLKWQPGAATRRVQVSVAGHGQKFIVADVSPTVAGGSAPQRPVEVATAAVGQNL